MYKDILEFVNNKAILNISYGDIFLLNYYQIGSKAIMKLVNILNTKIRTKKITKTTKVKNHIQSKI